MKRRLCSSILLTMVSGWVGAQTLTYTESQSGANRIPLGYDVPIPVDSLTPLDGFRTYNALNARHQQLALASPLITQHQIGTTYNGRPIFAYQFGDSDDTTLDGELEGTSLINGGIHAREWQTPEAVTGYMEYLSDNQQDQYLAQYLLENSQITLIPVLNVDGFLQTQRFPDQVTENEVTPRDGRMRRKNMREVDEDLSTNADNLNGIDLNRNNNPFWATSQRSSSDSTSLVYHGTQPASEPETQALSEAAVLSGEQRIRLYIDTHSFSQIYFGVYNGNAGHDRMVDRIAAVMRAQNNNKYLYDPSPANQGIGSTDEFFANQYNAISYTLEIEPLNSATQYGGFGVSHDGFILPESEVSRMRDETRKATMMGLYTLAEIPYLRAAEIRLASDNSLLVSAQWQKQGATRNLSVTVTQAPEGGQDYLLRLVFNKPMTLLNDAQNQAISKSVQVSFVGKQGGSDVSYLMSSNLGEWKVASGFSRYKSDVFEVPFSFADGFDWSAHTLLALSVDVGDMVGQRLDADPSTPATWELGSWQQYQDSTGSSNNDVGGIDKSLRFINDGSPLFDNTPGPGPGPGPDSGGSGGGVPWWLLGLMLIPLMLRLTARHSR